MGQQRLNTESKQTVSCKLWILSQKSFAPTETMPKVPNSKKLCPRKNGVDRGIYLLLEELRLGTWKRANVSIRAKIESHFERVL